jgi:DNA-binding SARP family transcriptional activator
VEFRILGSLVVVRGGRALELGGEQQRVLCALFVLNANRPLSADVLADALWGEPTPARAVKRLQVAIARLRRALDRDGPGTGSTLLETVPGGYRLTVAAEQIDAEVFSSRLREGRRELERGAPARAVELLSDALELWRGPPLPEVAYRPFAQAEIRRLEEMRLTALEARIDAELQLGRHAALIGDLEALVLAHPEREGLAGSLMLALYRSGRQADALAAYQRTRGYLATELGLEPAPALQRLQSQILQQAPQLEFAARGAEASAPVLGPAAGDRVRPTRARELPGPVCTDAHLVGRTDELAAVLRAIKSRAERGGQLTLLTGEAGIGKSALAARAAREAHKRLAMTVLYGSCDEEPLSAYQPFAEALRELLDATSEAGVREAVGTYRDDLALLVPGLSASAPATTANRLRLFEAVDAAIAAIGSPVLFVVDDVHWADAATLTMLRHVLRRGRAPLAVLATSRESGHAAGPLGDLVVDLRRGHRLVRIGLEGLPVAASEELLARCGQTPDAEVARAIQARTGGNPFFLEQIAITGLQKGVPEGVKELIGQSLARLPGGAADIVQTAAVIGADFGLEPLERVIDGSRAETLAALEAALASGLIVEAVDGPGRFAFRHSLVREAIHDAMPATRRADRHLHIGHALAASARPRAAEVAHHLLHARPFSDAESVIAWSLQAAKDASSALDWEQEVAHHLTALQLLDESGSADDATRGKVLLELGNRLITVGGDDEAAFRRALEIAGRHGWHDMLGEAANGLAIEREYGVVDAEVVAGLERALEVLGDQDSAWRARLLGRLADMLAIDGREPQRREALSREAVAMARRLDDRVALMSALESRALAIAGPDQLQERIQLLTEARHLAANHPDPAWASSIRDELVTWLTAGGRIREARGEVDALARLVVERRLQGTYPEARVLRLRAVQAVVDGRLEDALTLAQASAERFEDLREPDAPAIRFALLLPIKLEQNRAAELIDAVAHHATRSPGQIPWRAALCLLLASAGRSSEAASQLAELTSDNCSAIPRLQDWLGALTMLAHAAAELREPSVAATLERLLDPYADQLALFFYGCAPLGPVAHALGRLAAIRGDGERAVSQLQRAHTMTLAIPAPRWARRIRIDLVRATP